MLPTHTMTRRTLLAELGTAAVTACGGGLAWPGPLSAASPPRAAGALRAMAIDMHSHVPILAPGETFDLAGGMRRNRFSAICATYPVDAVRVPVPGQWYADYVRWLDGLDRIIESSGARRGLRATDLEEAHERSECAVIVAAEGAQFLEGKLDRIEQFHRRGLRHMQLVHSVHDPVAPLADLQTSDPMFDGLTGFGREVVQECNRLGIVVDMAHASPKAVRDTMAASATPVIFSHTSLLTSAGLGAIAENRDQRLPMRLLRKEDALAVAQAGGIVGVWHIFASLHDYVAELVELAGIIGADHVAIGSDTSVAGNNYAADSLWPDEKSGFIPSVAGELARQGVADGDIMKMLGGNYFSLFRKICP